MQGCRRFPKPWRPEDRRGGRILLDLRDQEHENKLLDSRIQDFGSFGPVYPGIRQGDIGLYEGIRGYVA